MTPSVDMINTDFLSRLKRKSVSAQIKITTELSDQVQVTSALSVEKGFDTSDLSFSNTSRSGLVDHDRVKEMFYYCERGNEIHGPEVSLAEGCNSRKKKLSGKAFFSLGQKLSGTKIIAKNVYEIEGTAFECRITRLQRYSFENFFGIGTQNTLSKKNEIVSESECWEMVKSKTCVVGAERLTLTCDRNNFCSVDTTPRSEYKWMTEYVRDGFICQTQPVPLFVRNRTQPLFGISSCFPSYGFCHTENSIIVWNKDLASRCPYAIIDRADLESGTVAAQANMLYDQLNQHSFEVTGTVLVCGTVLYTTSQGIFLQPSTDKFSPKMEHLAHTQLDTLHELILSEIDGRDFKLSRALDVIRKRFCEQIIESLASLSKQEDAYRILTNSQGKETVFYTRHGKVFKPKCVPVETITFVGHGTKYEDKCPLDMEVLFTVLSSTGSATLTKGFLTEHKIITAVSPLTRPCASSVKRAYPKMNAVVTRKDQKYEFSQMNSNRISVIDVDDESFVQNMRHFAALKEDIDLISGLSSTKLLSEFFVVGEENKLQATVQQRQILRGLALTMSDGAKYFTHGITEIFTNFLSFSTFLKLGTIACLIAVPIVVYRRVKTKTHQTKTKIPIYQQIQFLKRKLFDSKQPTTEQFKLNDENDF